MSGGHLGNAEAPTEPEGETLCAVPQKIRLYCLNNGTTRRLFPTEKHNVITRHGSAEVIRTPQETTDCRADNTPHPSATPPPSPQGEGMARNDK